MVPGDRDHGHRTRGDVTQELSYGRDESAPRLPGFHRVLVTGDDVPEQAQAGAVADQSCDRDHLAVHL